MPVKKEGEARSISFQFSSESLKFVFECFEACYNMLPVFTQ